MIYEEQLVKNIVASIIAGKYSIRAASKLLGASRNTISTWVSRTKSGLPTRFKRTAKRVWNRTSSEVLRSAKKCMKSGKYGCTNMGKSKEKYVHENNASLESKMVSKSQRKETVQTLCAQKGLFPNAY